MVKARLGEIRIKVDLATGDIKSIEALALRGADVEKISRNFEELNWLERSAIFTFVVSTVYPILRRGLR